MIALSDKTKKLIDAVVPSQDRDRISERLANEFWESERICFSILRILHESEMKQEDYAFEITKMDWRDLLVAAGHADNVDAHNHWADSILKDTD